MPIQPAEPSSAVVAYDDGDSRLLALRLILVGGRVRIRGRPCKLSLNEKDPAATRSISENCKSVLQARGEKDTSPADGTFCAFCGIGENGLFALSHPSSSYRSDSQRGRGTRRRRELVYATVSLFEVAARSVARGGDMPP